MTRRKITNLVWVVAVLATGSVVAGCGGASSGSEATPPDPTARLYDEFLGARTLAASLTAPRHDLDAIARERKIFEERRTLRNLEAGVVSMRALLADSRGDLPADSPNESVYFQIWSSHLGDGDKPLFRRLAGGGIEYAGKKISKEEALPCAVPARLNGNVETSFLDCLTPPQSASAR